MIIPYRCLQAPESDQKYARWCKHQGRDMFIIECIPGNKIYIYDAIHIYLKPFAEFTETVLPRLFKHCKFPSFVRQLNVKCHIQYFQEVMSQKFIFYNTKYAEMRHLGATLLFGNAVH